VIVRLNIPGKRCPRLVVVLPPLIDKMLIAIVTSNMKMCRTGWQVLAIAAEVSSGMTMASGIVPGCTKVKDLVFGVMVAFQLFNGKAESHSFTLLIVYTGCAASQNEMRGPRTRHRQGLSD